MCVCVCTGHLLSYIPCGCLSQQTHDTRQHNDSLLETCMITCGGYRLHDYKFSFDIKMSL